MKGKHLNTDLLDFVDSIAKSYERRAESRLDDDDTQLLHDAIYMVKMYCFEDNRGCLENNVNMMASLLDSEYKKREDDLKERHHYLFEKVSQEGLTGEEVEEMKDLVVHLRG